MDSGHFIESFTRRSMLLADLKKVTSGIGNCSLASYCLVVTQATHCSEFCVTKHPIANNRLIRHFKIEKGTRTAQLFLGLLLGTCWSAIGHFFLLSQKPLRKLTRPSFLPVSTVANSPFQKREGNWAELAFAKASVIVTGDALVSYWPLSFPVPTKDPKSLCES